MRLRHTFYSLLILLLTGGLISAIPSAAEAQSVSTRVVSRPDLDTLYNDLNFRPVGPTRGGRVTAVEGHRSHPATFYMGGAGGSGVWKTDNYGQSWQNISDGHGFLSTSIGAIQVADSDTNIIYVGTGTDGIRANVTTGRGMYKSTDAGESWQFIGLEEAGQIGAVEVHPENPERVYVAALGHPFGENPQRGVFRSDDGGENWDKVLFASDSTGAIDLEMHPENPDIIYAALWRAERKPWTIISGAASEDGLYKSTDGGDTWSRLDNGLPQGLTGKADFAVSPAAPDRVYALVEAPGDQEGLYRSDDRGENWELVNSSGGIMTRPFYFTNIEADPQDADIVHVGNVGYYVSTDGGENFDRRRTTHADVHDFWFNPDDPDIQIQGNDGGATVTRDGGETWSTQMNQNTAELYTLNVDDRFPYWLYAGQQDNSTISVPSLPPAENSVTGDEGVWHAVGGCETGPAVPKVGQPAIIFSNCKGRFGKYNVNTGQEQSYWVGGQYMYGRNPAKLEYRFQRVSPIEVSPHNPEVVYHGSQYLHRTVNGGETWVTISPDLTAFKPEFQMASGGPITRDITGEEHYSTLYSIAVSPTERTVIWTGANDGPVHVTRSLGQDWTEVTPEDLPPNGRVDAIEASPHASGKAYIAVHRRLLDDFDPYIYRTEDYGETWTRLTPGDNGLPEGHPVRVVREDPSREGLLYAGTDWGLFVSFDDGQNWQPLNAGLPNTPITDIKVHEKDLVLSTMGRGFWILDNLTPLHQMSADIVGKDRHLYTPRDAWRMRYRGGFGGGVPQYPSAGAIIDFNLSDSPAEPVTLEILDENDEVIRTFAGVTDDYDRPEEEQDPARVMMTPEGPPPAVPDTFEVREGHNRFVWDLRYPGETVPSEAAGEYFGVRSGPLALPGRYTVRLSAGDWSESRPLRLKMDPRVREAGVTEADLKAQLEYNFSLRNTIGRANRLAAEIEKAQDGLEQLADKETVTEDEMETIRRELDRLHSELVTSDEGSYQPPMLISQLGYLYNMTSSADQHPGNHAYSRHETLREELSLLATDWQDLQNMINN